MEIFWADLIPLFGIISTLLLVLKFVSFQLIRVGHLSNNFDIMKLSEIREEKDEDKEGISVIDREAQSQRERLKIREIIEYQKSLYSNSSSSSSGNYSRSLLSSQAQKKSNSLFSLMRSGNSSLRRLFDMEHTSLTKYFEEYSGSPMIKPVCLWGSDSEREVCQDKWEFVKQLKAGKGSEILEEFGVRNRKTRTERHRLSRKKKSFRRLPGFSLLWICRGFIFRLRLRKKLRIVCCIRK